MNQIHSLTNRFPGIFLAAFLTMVSASAAPDPPTVAGELNSAEKWVVEMVTAGKMADLEAAVNPDQTKKFPTEKSRILSAQFVGDLLTGMLSSVKPHRNGVRIRGANIEEALDLRNAQISAEVGLENCRFGSTATFTGTAFLGTVSFNNSTFRADASFNSAKIGRGVFLKKTVFEGAVDFGASDIGIAVVANEAQFNNKDRRVNFNNMKVGRTANFEKAIFEGPVNFRSADIGVNFQANGAEFRSKTQNAQLQMKCGNIGVFIGTTFGGSVSLADSTFVDLIIRGTKADAPEISQLDLSRSSIKRELRLEKISIHDLIASSLHVEGPTTLTDVSVGHVADLSNSEFATLDLSGSRWPQDSTDASFRMQGMTYKYIRAAPGDERESHEALLKLAEQSAYTADVYTELEAFLSKQGYRDDADRAFIAGKQRERNKHLHGLGWLGSWLLDWLVGYGRHPSYIGVPCAFFVVLGCFLFTPRKMELQNPDDAHRVYNPFWYSLGLFLPFVDLQVDKVWKPKQKQTFLRNYVRVHILLGWILIPILLAALSGLIK